MTNLEYNRFLQDTKYEPVHSKGFLRHWQGSDVPTDMHCLPVVWISIDDAKAFAAWKGFRLPADEEWQFIASGPEENKWPWGDQFDPQRCNHDGGCLTSVKRYRSGSSWCGCYDLSGNAWKWTATVQDDGKDHFALLRGGSFFQAPDHWHVASGVRPCDFHWKPQLLNPEINRSSVVGFRCVYGTSALFVRMIQTESQVLKGRTVQSYLAMARG